MRRRRKSPKSDFGAKTSPIGDVAPRLVAQLKAARQERQLSQQELAKKLGLRQRQVSDLERGKTDSRLTTVQNIARALDLELTLIPRPLISAVEALRRARADTTSKPLYSLDDIAEADVPSDTSTHVEAGDTSDLHAAGDTPAPKRAKRRSR